MSQQCYDGASEVHVSQAEHSTPRRMYDTQLLQAELIMLLLLPRPGHRILYFTAVPVIAEECHLYQQHHSCPCCCCYTQLIHAQLHMYTTKPQAAAVISLVRLLCTNSQLASFTLLLSKPYIATANNPTAAHLEHQPPIPANSQ
jgi:hypothetical protein